MKLKQIESILKNSKTIIVCEDAECQWFNNEIAYYPVFGLPKMSQENIFTMFDIPEDKKDKYYFAEQRLPQNINFADIDGTEHALKRGNILLSVSGRVLEPLITSQGIVYINAKYLKPFDDIETVVLYERTTTEGEIYIAVKQGMLCSGIIKPQPIISERFVSQLKSLYELTDVALSNLNKKEVN